MDTKEKYFLKFSFSIVKIHDFSLLGIRRTESHSEMEVLQMQKNDIVSETNEELVDALIAISVVAKKLAKSLANEAMEEKECQIENCMDCPDRQSQ